MMVRSRYMLILLALLAVSPWLVAKNKPAIEHAPLPAKVLESKTILIQNDSGWAEASDKAYTALKSWGRFQIVDTKEKADLVLVLQTVEQERNGSDTSWVSAYNSQTSAWTNGTVESPSTHVVRFTQIKLIDTATSQTAWADRLIWRRKRSATEKLIESLRQRIEEQEKQATASK
jgi:hypothetical protein